MKVERLYGITIYLLNHGRASAAELAKYFEVSVRTIQRDVDSLCVVGIPIIAVTGAIDLVSDGEKCYVIKNGRPEMGKITGTGCQLSGMMTAFAVANPENRVDAAAAAVCTMGIAGETAWDRMKQGDGNSTYRNRIIDAIYNMSPRILSDDSKYMIL